MGFQAEL